MMVINELLLEVRKSIRLHKLLISIANHMRLSVIGCMSNRQCNCRSNIIATKIYKSTASAIIPINGMRIHMTNCFLFSQREQMLWCCIPYVCNHPYFLLFAVLIYLHFLLLMYSYSW